MQGRMIRTAAALGALLFLAGCYETEFPVIEAGKGDEIPGFAGSYSVGDKGTAVIEDTSGTSGGNEYLFHVPTGEKLEFRADTIRDGFWLVQLGRPGDDGSMRYLFLFMSGEGNSYVFKVPNMTDKSGAIEKLAAAHGVEVMNAQPAGSNEIRIELQGSRENIHAFLRAHPGKVAFNDATPMVPQ